MWPILGMFTITTLLLFIVIWIYFKRDESNLVIKDINLDIDRLAEHGEEIGALYKTNRKANVKGLLLNRLNRSFRGIEKAYLKFNKDISMGKSLPKGTEWLLDNFYLIELAYKELKVNLKKEEKIVLNIIETGSLKGYPRIYGLALELISHSAGNITE